LKFYFISNVDLGFGSMPYLYLLKNIKKIFPKGSFKFVAPYTKTVSGKFDKPDFINKMLWKNRLSLRLIYLLIIIKSYFSDLVIINTYPIRILNFISKRTILINYYIEIWSDINTNIEQNFKYFDRTKLVIVPQIDRVAKAKELFPNSKFFLVENCVELRPLNQKASNFSNKTILYQGQISKLANADKLFSTIRMLKDVEVHLAGPVQECFKQELIDITREHSNIMYHGNLTSLELVTLRKQANIGLITWMNDTETTKFAAPTKLYEYISDGIYVICFPNYSLENLNKKYNFGTVLKDPLELNDVIKKISQKELIQRYKHNLNLYQSSLNYDAQIKQFLSSLQSYINYK